MSRASTHFIPTTNTYVTVILPMAVPKPYTYYVPEEWISEIKFGVRVEVQFGQSRLYTALVIEVHHHAPEGHQPKPISAVVDEQPLINPMQLQLWRWIADYYCCTLGEVMNAALPSNLKLASETLIALSPVFDGDVTDLSEKEHIVVQSLTAQNELSIEDLRKILDQKTVYPLIKSLLEKKIIYLQEDLKTKYSPKTVGCVRLCEPYASEPDRINEAYDKLTRSNRQEEALLAYLQLIKKQEFIRKQDIYDLAKVDAAVLTAMAKKGIFELYEREVSRLGGYEEETIDSEELAPQQEEAISKLRAHLESKNVALLHGVTGSGKTRVYVELMQEAINRGEQVLYLLPEIALTTQIINRLQKIFGDKIAVYHSRLNNNERVELWKQILEGKPIVIGARSALFMPFTNLKLVIVDEEHDPSYKQNDPNPRYNGRDAAIYMANTFDAKVILGTATPSIESYYNAKAGKYALIEMPERFGGLELPETIITDVKQELKERKLQAHFTTTLIDELKAALERGEQAILFQNRRGFAPTYRCTTCGWHSECIHCDVSLTYHKHFNALKCHYCGYQTQLPAACPACGNKQLTLIGFGTEKIEDELKIYLPEARIARMDLDTVRTKNAHTQIINDFEERRVDILVGTQMVTKGLDFDNVGIVGVLSADQLLQFPDFRASERAFQLMLQVSGRAGRKHKRGKVIIQAMNTASPVLGEVLRNDFFSFFQREIQERHEFQYPPFTRLIRITLKHKKPETLNDGAKIFAKTLKSQLGDWVIGPAVPYVGRVRGYFLLDFLIKLPRDSQKIRYAKDTLLDAIQALNTSEGYTTIRVNVDVDPY
ncbi:MAG: primosomal protein N' [Saprospiraceae bacterium]|nr:primosomal protein N' [Saprospiraceae bacterium]